MCLNMNENWLLKKRCFDPSILENFSLKNNIIIEILSRRNLKNLDELLLYLNKGSNSEHDPFLLHNMKEATGLIINDIKNKNKIMIALDYDVDGIISGVIPYFALIKLGAECDYIFPDRVADGYGLNRRIVQYAIDHGFHTIITFDNGISAHDAISLARQNDLKIIVTDHHEVPKKVIQGIVQEDLVEANAIINPKQLACNYPYKGICGAMIAYKLMEALYEELHIPKDELKELYNLVSIATICDVMDLEDENRSFVSNGLRGIMNSQLLGIQVLLEKLDLSKKPSLSVNDIGFLIGPIFNSSGRLETAESAFKLLTSTDKKQASEMADYLINLNTERKFLTREATSLAKRIIEDHQLYKNNIIILLLEDVHESLAGIIAGRIKEEYHLPSIVFTHSKSLMKGSARSTDHIDIFSELSLFKDSYESFGGHPAAAGLSLKEGSFFKFKREIEMHFNSLNIERKRDYYVDFILPLKDVNLNLLYDLDIFEPTGKGNPSIIFSSLSLNLKKLSLLGENQSVLKLEFGQGETTRNFNSFSPDKTLDYIKNKMNFSKDSDIIDIESNLENPITFDLLYKVTSNYYQNREYLNLEIVSIR